MAEVRDYKLAVLLVKSGGTSKGISCITSRDESYESEIETMANSCTQGKKVDTIKKINRTITLNGLCLNEEVTGILNVKDFESIFNSKEEAEFSFMTNAIIDSGKSFKGLITQLDITNEHEEYSTFTATIVYNKEITE